jgi:hypothetical protein
MSASERVTSQLKAVRRLCDSRRRWIVGPRLKALSTTKSGATGPAWLGDSVLGEHAGGIESYGLELAQLLDAAGGEQVG